MCERSCRPLAAVGWFRFVECGHCGFVFAPAVRQDAMVRAYERGHHGPDDGAPDVGWASLEFLGPALDRLGGRWRLNILDFGCGQSYVPAALRAEGHRVVAVDLAPPLQPHPDRLTGDLRTLKLAPGTFDLAFAFQVFEHLPEPRPFLDELLRLTRPGGLVLVHTDMETAERARGFARWWYVAPPDHCAFYRHRTFEVYLAGTPHRLSWRDPKAVLIQVGHRQACAG
jgi:SAM-dependent methyltransferase